MSKHTPGPWIMEADGRIWTPSREACQTIGYFQGEALPQKYFDQHIPNCRLIAASPSLLEAARLLLDLTHSERNWPNLSCGEETIALRSRLNNLRDIVLSLEEAQS